MVGAVAMSLAALSAGLSQPPRTEAQSVRSTGAPAFMIAAWGACTEDVPGLKAMHVNIVVTSLCDEDELAGAAAAHGMYSILTMGQDGDTGRYDRPPADRPNLIGGLQPDEPDFHHIPAGQLELPSANKITLLNLTQNSWNSHGPGDELKKYGNLLTTDIYPLEESCYAPQYIGVYSVYDVQRTLAATGQPNFQWLEANEISGICDHVLAPLEVDAEAYLSLEGGADGLGWFFPAIPAGSGGWRSFSVRPDVQQAITVINAEALAMQDIWLADEIDGFSTPPGSDGQNAIKVTGRMVKGNNYAIATNSTDEKVVWQRQLPDLPSHGTAIETNLTLGAANDARRITADENGITETFGPYETRMFVYAPAQKVAVPKATKAKTVPKAKKTTVKKPLQCRSVRLSPAVPRATARCPARS
jgi:hypothetical protein